MTKNKYTISTNFLKNTSKVEKNVNNETTNSGPANFEAAITATGFGWYNLLLIFIAFPSGWSSVFETTTMSYVFPAAQCDLNLSLDDKGFLNAITYLGMISSAIIWGFLFDTLGRKRLIFLGFLMDAFFVILGSFSQNKTMLVVAKFFGGLTINGPFAALTSYISEFHSAKYRAKMQLVLGTTFSLGSVILPILAWAVMPRNIFFTFYNLEFHSWNVYLLISSFASLSSCIIFMFLPESPKFLMTVGQNEKALTVFKKVYSINTGKPMDTYTIKTLEEETKKENSPSAKLTAKRTKVQALGEGWQQMKPLFFPPYLGNIILVCFIQMLFTMSLNTLRLWLPQIFQATNDYQFSHNGTGSDLCTMLQMIQPNKFAEKCVVNLENDSVYINSIIVATVSIFSYVLAGSLINILGKKKLLNILGLTSGISAFMIYFSSNMLMIICFSSIFISSASIATNVTLTVIIDLFPTTLRTMTVSLAMMLARTGAMMGNLMFPVLLRTGCAPPFFSIGSVIIGCAFLSLLLPNTDLKALE